MSRYGSDGLFPELWSLQFPLFWLTFQKDWVLELEKIRLRVLGGTCMVPSFPKVHVHIESTGRAALSAT